jgi:hypothetical protein
MRSAADNPAETTDATLSVYLAKYASLREELFQRFQFQGQAFNFLVVTLTALLAVGAAQFGEGHDDFIIGLSLFVPLVTGPFGYLYLAHDLMIFGISGYIEGDLSRDVSRLLGRDVSLTDSRFAHLTDAGRLAHRVLAPSRWLLFVFPTVIPVVYAAFFTSAWKTYPLSVLFILDCVVIVVLLVTMAAVAREQAAWRRQLSEPDSPPRADDVHRSEQTPTKQSAGTADDPRPR